MIKSKMSNYHWKFKTQPGKSHVSASLNVKKLPKAAIDILGTMHILA
jgi:hypothetical protein